MFYISLDCNSFSQGILLIKSISKYALHPGVMVHVQPGIFQLEHCTSTMVDTSWILKSIRSWKQHMIYSGKHGGPVVNTVTKSWKTCRSDYGCIDCSWPLHHAMFALTFHRNLSQSKNILLHLVTKWITNSRVLTLHLPHWIHQGNQAERSWIQNVWHLV